MVITRSTSCCACSANSTDPADASGIERRLNRDLSGAFGSKKYAFEELVAETTSAFVSLTLNLPTEMEIVQTMLGTGYRF